jgi:hypothetical protein
MDGFSVSGTGGASACRERFDVSHPSDDETPKDGAPGFVVEPAKNNCRSFPFATLRVRMTASSEGLIF